MSKPEHTRTVGTTEYEEIRPTLPTPSQHRAIALIKIGLKVDIPHCITLKRLSPKMSRKSLAKARTANPRKYAKEMDRLANY